MRRTLLLCAGLFLLTCSGVVNAQVAINATGATADGSAMLDVSSTSKGFLPPRVALTGSTDGTTISSPATGLIIYNTATTSLGTVNDVTPGFYYNAGTSGSANWVQVVNSTGVGTASVWDDFVVSPSVKASQANGPTWTAFQPGGSGGLFALAFSGGSQMGEVFFDIQMPHSWKEGTTIYPHIHWAPADGTSGDVVWYLEYSWATFNSTFPATTTVNSGAAAAGGTAFAHKISSIPSSGGISGSGKTISSVMRCRLYRDPTGSDTYSGNAFAISIDIHYEVNSAGSRLQYTK